MGTPVPIISVEKAYSDVATIKAGEIAYSTMTKEDYARLAAIPNPHLKKKKEKVILEKEQYIAARAGGQSRAEYAIMNNINTTALKCYLVNWELIDPTAEQKAIDDFRGITSLPVIQPVKITETKQKENKKGDDITKEFVIGEIAKGKNLARIAQEYNILPGTLYARAKTWGIQAVSRKKSEVKLTTEMLSPELFENTPPASLYAANHEIFTQKEINISPFNILPVPPELTNYIPLHISIRTEVGSRVEETENVWREIEALTALIDDSRSNRKVTTQKIYDLCCAYANLIRAELKDLVSESEVDKLHRSYFTSFNEQRTEVYVETQ